MDRQYGHIVGENRLVMRDHIGTASTGEGPETFNFELGSVFLKGCPVVRCVETGKTFVLTWEDVLDLAAVAGITQPKADAATSNGTGESK